MFFSPLLRVSRNHPRPSSRTNPRRINAFGTREEKLPPLHPLSLSPWWWSFEIGRNLWKRRPGQRSAILRRERNEAITYWLELLPLAAPSHLPIRQLVISMDTTGTARLADCPLSTRPSPLFVSETIQFSAALRVTREGGAEKVSLWTIFNLISLQRG